MFRNRSGKENENKKYTKMLTVVSSGWFFFALDCVCVCEMIPIIRNVFSP